MFPWLSGRWRRGCGCGCGYEGCCGGGGGGENRGSVVVGVRGGEGGVGGERERKRGRRVGRRVGEGECAARES